MNRFLRGASLAAALIVSTSMFFACGNNPNGKINKKDFEEKLTFINEVSDKALNIEKGEILVNETVTLENDIESVAKNRTIETYVRFSNGPEMPDFELEKTTCLKGSEDVERYTFVKSGETMFELFNGVGEYAEEAPDIYEALRIDFDVDSIKNIEVLDAEKGNDCYKLTMVNEYANKFDKDSDGVKFDCTEVIISYYVDSLGHFTKRTCEITTTLIANGESQSMTQFIEAKIK